MRQKGVRFIVDCMDKLQMLGKIESLQLSGPARQKIAKQIRDAYATEAARFVFPALVGQAERYASQALQISQAIQGGQIPEDNIESTIREFYQCYLRISDIAQQTASAGEQIRQKVKEQQDNVLNCWLSRQVGLADQIMDMESDEIYVDTDNTDDTLASDTL